MRWGIVGAWGTRLGRSALAVALVGVAAPSAAGAVTRVNVVDQDGVELQVIGDAADERITIRDVTSGGQAAVRVEARSGSPALSTNGGPCRVTTATISDGARSVTCTIEDVPVLEAGLDAGADELDASPLTLVPLSASGGSGNDQLTGSPVADFRISGGAGDDLVDGGAGDDPRLFGDTVGSSTEPGNDVVLGGVGDDEVIGADGSDIVSGGPGLDTTRASGTIVLADLLCNDGSERDAHFLEAPNGSIRSRVVEAPEGRLECTSDVSARDLYAGIEVLTPFRAVDGIDVTGGPGPEFLAGIGAFGDVFESTGPGAPDRLEGGGGVDSLAGNFDDDLLLARDGEVDALISCSDPGSSSDIDRAVVDLDDPVESDCETIERGSAGAPGPVGGGTPAPFEGFPAPSPPQGDQPSTGTGTGTGGGDPNLAPELQLPEPTATIDRRGRLSIRVRCVYRAQSCVGKLELEAAKDLRAKKKRIEKGDELGSKPIAIPWGTSEPTVLKAPRKLREVLAAFKTTKVLKAKVTVTARDSAGGPNALEARVSRKMKIGVLAGKAKRIG